VKTLFEYGAPVTITDRNGLETYLHSLWREYKALWPDKSYNPQYSNNLPYQPFLSFDGDSARANNFVGFIHYENMGVEIYPKVFQNLKVVNRDLMHRHLFYWFSYCKKIKSPFNQSFLDNFEIDQFPELIIYLIARQINEAVNQQPYSSYEEVQEVLSTPRGRINFNRYTNRLSYGGHHLIDCDHQPFVFNNTLNRIIKYCTRLLLTKTRLPETQRILNETISLLDEVEDQVCAVQQLNGLRITALFQTYEEVIHSCRMILENQIYSHAEYEMKTWSLLFPMEYVFEDFIAGFMRDHFGKEFIVEPQKSELYLHQDPKTFNVQHDILLTNRATGERIIVDTKYKPRWENVNDDPKKGVSQIDMYQMISYAYKRGTDKVLMIYPNSSDLLTDDYTFKIDSFEGDRTICIKAVDVPFWSSTGSHAVDDALKLKLLSVLKNY
jgi:5-methylcytosine-specific restriction enzyme subunit McrC